ncbi:MAG: hypothetical protein ACLQVI_33595 [Polyangiaceae bacterium]|jgi:hypothetical protein
MALAIERVTIEVDGDDVESVAAQIPSADTMAPGTRLVVFAGKSRRWLGKLLPPRGAPPLAAIGSALLARGYVGIGGGEESGRTAVWGQRRS